jgi:hypothetical protein
MSTGNDITHDRSINNFIIKLGLTLYLTIPQLKHVCEFLYGTVGHGCNAKVDHIAENCFYSTHRTSIGKFLSKSSWNEDFVLKALQKCAFHRSHLEGKTVYGHQVVEILLQCDDVVIPYQLILYDKDKVDENKEKIIKIKIAINAISSLPKPPKKGFVLGLSKNKCA